MTARDTNSPARDAAPTARGVAGTAAEAGDGRRASAPTQKRVALIPYQTGHSGFAGVAAVSLPKEPWK